MDSFAVNQSREIRRMSYTVVVSVGIGLRHEGRRAKGLKMTYFGSVPTRSGERSFGCQLIFAGDRQVAPK